MKTFDNAGKEVVEAISRVICAEHERLIDS